MKKVKSWLEKYNHVGNFSGGRAYVQLDGKWGHVDKSGAITTPLVYDDVGNFHGGRAWVELDGKQGHVDESGTVNWDY